jgi:ankyrin repeat protein
MSQDVERNLDLICSLSEHQSNDKELERLIHKNQKILNVMSGPSHSTLIHRAIKNYNLRLTELLIKYGADIEIEKYPQSNDTPLNLAIKRNNLGAMKILLNNGAIINPDYLLSFELNYIGDFHDDAKKLLRYHTVKRWDQFFSIV